MNNQKTALNEIYPFLKKCWYFNHYSYFRQKSFGTNLGIEKRFQRYYQQQCVELHVCFLLDCFKNLDNSWKIAGGTMLRDGNQTDLHWWLENEEKILDMTASQFGF